MLLAACLKSLMDSIDVIKPQVELSASPPEQETLYRLSSPSPPFSCVFLGLIKKVSLGFDDNKIYTYMYAHWKWDGVWFCSLHPLGEFSIMYQSTQVPSPCKCNFREATSREREYNHFCYRHFSTDDLISSPFSMEDWHCRNLNKWRSKQLPHSISMSLKAPKNVELICKMWHKLIFLL